ncbi:hypothetical protein P5W98_00675 [Paraburkholderia sp. A1BS-2L]|uniref:hypothetical protein n=1 Tax=Paraburkholderia sp. A1BS-2L TaxID=3028373 RepID=UPI003DA882C3
MSTRSNKLQRLAKQFEAEPRQTELRQLKVQLATVADSVDQQVRDLMQTFDRLRVLKEVQFQPDLLRDDVDRFLASARTNTQALVRITQANESHHARVSVPLDNLTKSARALADAIRQAWELANQDEVEKTVAFIALTASYDPEAQQALQVALRRFKAVDVANGKSGVSAYCEAREALDHARKSLNIPGAVGQFLQDALHGKGSARMLGDPQVQEFLNKHPVLWTKMLVKLG